MAGRFEQEIVVALGIERRVELNEVNGFGWEMLAAHLPMVATAKLVHAARLAKGRSGVNSGAP